MECAEPSPDGSIPVKGAEDGWGSQYEKDSSHHPLGPGNSSYTFYRHLYMAVGHCSILTERTIDLYTWNVFRFDSLKVIKYLRKWVQVPVFVDRVMIQVDHFGSSQSLLPPL